MKSVFGTLGLVALFAAVGLGMLATFGAFGQKSLIAFGGETPKGAQPGGAEGTTAEGIQQLKQTATSIGETVTAGDLSWTVTDARPTDELQKVTPPPKPRPGQFLIITFTVKNVSERPVTLDSNFLTLFSDDGRKFQPQSEVNGSYVEDEKNILFNENSILEPGKTKEGQANFELPLNTPASLLRLGGNNPNANEEEYVDLGS